jgi:RNA polymerase sigma-70 factor (ECF subfamily)
MPAEKADPAYWPALGGDSPVTGTPSKLHLLGLASHSTDELMLLVQHGDTLAFEELYHRMVPIIGRFLASRASGAAPVDDVLQEVFCRIWQQQGRFATGAASAKTYLLRVALNIHYEQVRKTHHAIPLSEAIASELADPHGKNENLESDDHALLLPGARSRLSNGQEAAVHLVYDEQMSLQEAAHNLGCSRQAIRRRLQEAHRKLHHCLRASVSLAPTEGTIKP